MRVIIFFAALLATACNVSHSKPGRAPASLSQDEGAAGANELIRRAERTKIEYGEYHKAAMDFKNCYATIGPEAGKFEVYVARTRAPVGVVGSILVEHSKTISPRNYQGELTEALRKCN